MATAQVGTEQEERQAMTVKAGRISADPDTALRRPAPVLLPFAAHFGLALCTLGLLLEPYDTSARLGYHSQQVCQQTGFL